jgi:hypothetical protein
MLTFIDCLRIGCFLVSLMSLSHRDAPPPKVQPRPRVSQRQIAERLCCAPWRWETRH